MSSLDSVDDALVQAVKDVRDDKTKTDWALGGFSSLDDWKMVLLGTGTGGAEELRAAINWGDACFGIIRKTFLYDESAAGMGPTNVTKFIFVACRPDNLPLKRKSKLSIFESSIKKIFQPFHTDLEVSNESEIGEKIVEDLIARITMKADKDATGKQAASFLMGGVAVNARTAQGDAASAKKQADTQAISFAGSAGGASVAFEDVDAVKAAIADVRNDATPTTWCLLGYADPKTIRVIGSGSGGVPEEMLAACPDKVTCYGLFRVSEQFELAKTVKFIFVTYQPADVPVMQRAAISTHKNVVQPIFRPYHADFVVSSRTEITYDSVMDHIRSLSGTKSMVTDKKPEKKEEKFERKTLGGLTNEKVMIQVDDPDVIKEAIAQVRKDGSGVEWCIAGTVTSGKDASLAFVSKGGEGLDGFRSAINDTSRVMFALVRRTHKIDQTDAVKFIFVTFQGETIPAWLKAKVGTFRGSVVDIFHPYHAEMFVNDVSELTDEAFLERIGAKN